MTFETFLKYNKLIENKDEKQIENINYDINNIINIYTNVKNKEDLLKIIKISYSQKTFDTIYSEIQKNFNKFRHIFNFILSIKKDINIYKNKLNKVCNIDEEEVNKLCSYNDCNNSNLFGINNNDCIIFNGFINDKQGKSIISYNSKNY